MKVQIQNFKVSIVNIDEPLIKLVCKKFNLKEKNIESIIISKESIDARDKNDIYLVYTLILDIKNVSLHHFKNNKNVSLYDDSRVSLKYNNWNHEYSPIIVGFGPAGLFSALYLARCNAKPIIIERGSDIDNRIIKVEEFLQNKILDVNTNIQFGEGGAGTFSDGKLTTNLRDPLIKWIIDEFVAHGAPEEIRYEAMPHIGTDYLRIVVKNIRKEIINLGGKFYFDTKFIDFETSELYTSVKLSNGESIKTNHLLLGFGHSARDTIRMLYEKGAMMEPKSFSMGVRIEHKRESINKAQYGKYHSKLKAAYYKLACHLDTNRSLYTFCMCPGGEVIASQSEENTILTNGMSYRSRDKDNSNSALLVNVDPSDYMKDSVLDGLDYQEKYEKLAFNISSDYRAPATLVGEFLNDEIPENYRSVRPSYPHGVVMTNLYDCLPKYVCDTIKSGLPILDKKLHGFADNDAVLTGVETRSSCPIRMKRDSDTRMSNLKGLYPIGEGAGYAGGITSAALDGLKTAIKITSD
ncbi:MAG: NAD(P)/FAD-dependent oxidoreductase [Anaeroplasmataceae bacterium]